MRPVRPEPHHFLAVINNINKLIKLANLMKLKLKVVNMQYLVYCILYVMVTVERNNTYLTCFSLRTALC